MLSKIFITKLIIYYSTIYGLDSNVALSVAKIESGLSPAKVGKLHELGVFQLRPEYFCRYTEEELKDPVIGIRVGIEHLVYLKSKSKLSGNSWVLAHNLGLRGSRRIKHPEQQTYKIRFNLAMRELK